MSRLDVLDDALIALAVFLYEHGPSCVCVPCTAYARSTALLPRLAHVLAILEAWEREDDVEPILPQDIRMLLCMLEEGSTVRPAGAGEGEEGGVRETTFSCWGCAALSDDPQEYAYPIRALAGYDAETGAPLCEGCVDAARDGAEEGEA